MFEKSLYDLIRGLRNHKGTERAYIQASLRECRSEIKSQDMDTKATALLKLVYLEMYGHDMSWASFHILEVMSSAKYLHKRIGYLAAAQSFRPDTEVLMLATNLLKKDITSSVLTTLTLPLITLPHIANSPLAMALHGDLLPRLTHMHAAVRKKAVVTLYRFALVYPEALRSAWPKIKERLMDENEDASVTAAIVNVVCELGWRRPQDFLPLAPRLFTLLVDGGNNWMAIKIIKLFATLTPLEPRLVRKLLPPLTSLIRTTPAMSLLYECINGIIQGGILENIENTAEGEEIAKLCVGKLRGMIAMEGDPNLKYVALLAFQKIVRAHSYFVSLHQDVILDCLDDADVSIRLRALDLLVHMGDSTNLVAIVSKLLRQLQKSPVASAADDPVYDRASQGGIVPAADSDDEEAEESIRPSEHRSRQPPPLSEDYRVAVIKRILEMCSRDSYANVVDFVWYIDTLVQLVGLAPAPGGATALAGDDALPEHMEGGVDVTRDIGLELQNVAVRVRDVRREATHAAESLIIGHSHPTPAESGMNSHGYLGPVVWLVGEYASLLVRPSETLACLVHSSSATAVAAAGALPAETLAVCVQAIPKVFIAAAAPYQASWGLESKASISLLIARVVAFLDPLTMHASLEVQERAVELAELMKLVADAVVAQPAEFTRADDNGDDHSGGGSGGGGGVRPEAPLVLTTVLPALFAGLELNPVAPSAQKKIPLPRELAGSAVAAADVPLSELLSPLLPPDFRLAFADDVNIDDGGGGGGGGDRALDEATAYYYRRPTRGSGSAAGAVPAAKLLDQAVAASAGGDAPSYQERFPPEDAATAARRRAERRERNRDDPFYIVADPASANASQQQQPSSVSSPHMHNIIRQSNGVEVDIDSIPIMDLDIGSTAPPERDGRRGGGGLVGGVHPAPAPPSRRRRAEVAGDETVSFGDFEVGADSGAGRAAEPRRNRRRDAAVTATTTSTTTSRSRSRVDAGQPAAARPPKGKGKKKAALLQVDSRGLGSVSLLDADNDKDVVAANPNTAATTTTTTNTAMRAHTAAVSSSVSPSFSPYLFATRHPRLQNDAKEAVTTAAAAAAVAAEDGREEGEEEEEEEAQAEGIDAEMRRALREVEARRLEMQRAAERIQVAQGVPAEGTLVKKKPKKGKKKTAAAAATSASGTTSGTIKKKKKKKIEKKEGEAELAGDDDDDDDNNDERREAADAAASNADSRY